ncbi:MAG TPA: RraA family protein [Actinomycetota bacterium]|nr:RraA family protein [Actinomycetota bacterium]
MDAMSPTPEVVAGFRDVAAASVADAVDRVLGRRGFMSSRIKPAFPSRIAGPAATVLEGPGSEPRPPIHALEAIDQSPPGTVVVIATQDPVAAEDVAVWGGLMSTAASARDLGGAVLDAGARDVAESRELGFPIFSRSVVTSTTVGRYVTLARDVPVTCGGVPVRPGDVVVGDEDGVVVVPAERAGEVLAAAREIEDAERQMAEEIGRQRSIIRALERFGRI